MQKFKQSEAAADRRRLPVLFVDATDGYTPFSPGGAITASLIKDDGSIAAPAGSLTGPFAAGLYYFQFLAADLDQLGFVLLKLTADGVRPFTGAAQVVAFDPYSADTLGLASFTSILSRLPSALIGGTRMDASVGAMASNVLTDTAIANSAITEIQAGLATAAELTLVKGLSNGNMLLDLAVYDGNGLMTSGRLRVYTPLVAGVSPLTPGVNVANDTLEAQEVARFLVVASGPSGKPTVYTSTKVLPFP